MSADKTHEESFNCSPAAGSMWTSIRAASRVSVGRRNAVMIAAYGYDLPVSYIAHAARLSVSQARRVIKKAKS